MPSVATCESRARPPWRRTRTPSDSVRELPSVHAVPVGGPPPQEPRRRREERQRRVLRPVSIVIRCTLFLPRSRLLDGPRGTLEMLDAMTSELARRGVTVVITVCGAQDEPKRRMLAESGLSVATEWYVKALP